MPTINKSYTFAICTAFINFSTTKPKLPSNLTILDRFSFNLPLGKAEFVRKMSLITNHISLVVATVLSLLLLLYYYILLILL